MNKSEVFEISQSALITDKDKLLLLQTPIWKWVFPWWKIDIWEKWDTSLQREVNEELWKRNIQILSILEVDNWEYQSKNKFGVFFHCIAENVENILLSDEHINYKWIWYEEVDNIEFFHEKMKKISKKVLESTFEIIEHDVFVIWKWLIWKYLIHELKDKRLDIWILDWYEQTHIWSDNLYNAYEYIDKDWVWDKNATGNVTFPTNDELNRLWFSLEEYKEIKQQLLEELWWINFEQYNDNEIDSLVNFVLNNLGIDNIGYFFSARNKIKKKQILDRWSFDKYWHNNKTFYDISYTDIDIIEWNAIKFLSLYNGNVDKLLIKSQNWYKIIKANKFILANHTVWIISLLQRSYKEIGDNFLDIEKLWLGFVEHPQLSIGAIIQDKNFVFERSLPTSYIYSDFSVDWVNFRIEYHTAPPIQEKTKKYLHSGITQEDFDERFIRFSCIIQQEPSEEKTIDFNDDWTLFITEEFKKEVKRLTNVVNKEFYSILDNEAIEILNSESGVFFSWHLIGWVQYLTDETNYKLYWINNLFIASSCVFDTWWLFNPTFTILSLAKKIVNENF